MRLHRVHEVIQQRGPVVGRDLIQGADEVVESVRDHRGRAALSTVESFAKIIERALIIGELADRGVDFEPDQLAFGIVVQAPPPILPSTRSKAQKLH